MDPKLNVLLAFQLCRLYKFIEQKGDLQDLTPAINSLIKQKTGIAQLVKYGLKDLEEIVGLLKKLGIKLQVRQPLDSPGGGVVSAAGPVGDGVLELMLGRIFFPQNTAFSILELLISSNSFGFNHNVLASIVISCSTVNLMMPVISSQGMIPEESRVSSPGRLSLDIFPIALMLLM